MVYQNPEELRIQLKAKGWTDQEINHTLTILHDAKTHKTKFEIFLDKSIFWVALFMLIAGNFVISVVLVPFMLVATPIYLYPGLFFIGLAFGKLFDIVIWDIEHLEHSTHFYPAAFLTAIAIINIYIITVLNNHLANFMELTTGTHSPIIVAAVYVVGFILPHLIKRRHKFFKISPKSL